MRQRRGLKALDRTGQDRTGRLISHWTYPHTAGILGLLSEDDPTLIHYALQQLNDTLVNQFWAEISDSITSIEVVYENADLPLETRNLAALLASKVYYHLAALDDALAFALSADGAFRVEADAAAASPATGDQDYTDTIVATCIDRYVDSRVVQEEGAASTSSKAVAASEGDMQKMQKIVEQMFNRCIQDGEHRQAMGIAIDARRLDVVERVFYETKDAALLSYVLSAIMTVAVKLDFRNKVRLSACFSTLQCLLTE